MSFVLRFKSGLEAYWLMKFYQKIPLIKTDENQYGIL